MYARIPLTHSRSSSLHRRQSHSHVMCKHRKKCSNSDWLKKYSIVWNWIVKTTNNWSQPRWVSSLPHTTKFRLLFFLLCVNWTLIKYWQENARSWVWLLFLVPFHCIFAAVYAVVCYSPARLSKNNRKLKIMFTTIFFFTFHCSIINWISREDRQLGSSFFHTWLCLIIKNLFIKEHVSKRICVASLNVICQNTWEIP